MSDEKPFLPLTEADIAPIGNATAASRWPLPQTGGNLVGGFCLLLRGQLVGKNPLGAVHDIARGFVHGQ